MAKKPLVSAEARVERAKDLAMAKPLGGKKYEPPSERSSETTTMKGVARANKA